MSSKENVNNSLVPLGQWYCDSCGKVISSPDDGLLEWYQDSLGNHERGKDKGFRIVHNDDKCAYDSRKMYLKGKSTSDSHLESFIGPDGLSELLVFIGLDKVEDSSEFVDIIRRLHTPYYEEARKYHSIAEQDGYFEGENPLTRYLTETSEYILSNYKR